MISIPNDQSVVDLILAHEGGVYTDDPADRGGPTMWGITIPTLAHYLGHDVIAADIQRVTRDVAANIYKGLYIRPFHELPDPLRINVIDMGVHAGVERATRLLQQMLGTKVDGVIGPRTRDLTLLRDWNPIYVGMRLAYYEHLIVTYPENAKWRNGWHTRAVSFCDAGAIRMKIGHGKTSFEPLYGYQGKAIAA
jgi:lysozyme family protein